VSEATQPAERRRGDRRRAARSIPQPPPIESWFGAFGVSPDAQHREEGWADAGESHFDAGWQEAEQAKGDSRFLSRQALRIVGTDANAFERIYAAFLAARAALGSLLFAAQVVAELFGLRPPLAVMLLCTAYAAQAVLWWRLPRFRQASAQSLAHLRSPQWLATIGVDLLSFSALHLLSLASGPNYLALLVLPVLMAGVLTPRVMALATAAAVTLMLLVTAWFAVMAGGDPATLMTQAGLAGSGFFIITLLAGELAGRLAREELTARGSLELARQQAQLNRLVIEEMQDGVLVVDRKGRVRAANPAARALLAPGGTTRNAPFQLRGVEAWEPFVLSVERAFAEAAWPEAGRDVSLQFSPGLTRTLRLRVRFTRRRDQRASEELCVLFIEDVRTVEARTRQEKLAAMGRVSAGIAHEIRNPLAAISQANALLAEDATSAAQRQLTQLVGDNVERLKRIVEDVMEVAPGATPARVCIDATAQVAAVCGEWARTTHLPAGDVSPLRTELPAEPVGVVFDAEHLRRVLVNLLDNALRHGGGTPATILLQLAVRGEREVVLSVASAGSAISPEVERYLFEPFFSTRSRGTGLGLYICRELCERYGANIDYRLRSEHDRLRNEFVVVMQRDTESAFTAPESRSLFAS